MIQVDIDTDRSLKKPNQPCQKVNMCNWPNGVIMADLWL